VCLSARATGARCEAVMEHGHGARRAARVEAPDSSGGSLRALPVLADAPRDLEARRREAPVSSAMSGNKREWCLQRVRFT
jgi:hypothetical protein